MFGKFIDIKCDELIEIIREVRDKAKEHNREIFDEIRNLNKDQSKETQNLANSLGSSALI